MKKVQLEKVKSFIRKDIGKLERQQKAEIEKISPRATNKAPNGQLITYLITRKNTLKEILGMLES